MVLYNRPPLALLMEVTSRKHQPFATLPEQLVPIFPVNMSVPVPVNASRSTTGAVTGARNRQIQKSVSRQQIPCSPAFSITIHKAQGKTFDQAVVDIEKPTTPPLGSAHDNYSILYVGLSRVRQLSDLRLLQPFSSTVLHFQPDTKLVAELKRLELLANQTESAYNDKRVLR